MHSQVPNEIVCVQSGVHCVPANGGDGADVRFQGGVEVLEAFLAGVVFGVGFVVGELEAHLRRIGVPVCPWSWSSHSTLPAPPWPVASRRGVPDPARAWETECAHQRELVHFRVHLVRVVVVPSLFSLQQAVLHSRVVDARAHVLGDLSVVADGVVYGDAAAGTELSLSCGPANCDSPPAEKHQGSFALEFSVWSDLRMWRFDILLAHDVRADVFSRVFEVRDASVDEGFGVFGRSGVELVDRGLA